MGVEDEQLVAGQPHQSCAAGHPRHIHSQAWARKSSRCKWMSCLSRLCTAWGQDSGSWTWQEKLELLALGQPLKDSLEDSLELS